MPRLWTYVLLGWAIVLPTPTDGQCDTTSGQVTCRPPILDYGFSVLRDDGSSLRGVRSVLIQCQNRNAESRLTNRTLSELGGGLKELVVDRCRMSTLPAVFGALSQLKKLEVRTFNSDVNLVMESGALSRLGSSLEELDLSENRMWGLPSGAVCALAGLRQFNFSHNQVQEVNDLGLSWLSDASRSDCHLRELRVLDLTSNGLVSLEADAFARLPSLTDIYLGENQIELLEDSALRGLTSLTHFNINNNRLVALPHEAFSYCNQLTELHIANNSISALTTGTLAGLQQLLVLDLSGNQLSTAWLNSGTFAGLMRLVVLDLSRNRLTQVDPSIFADLYSLQSLRLDGNQIDVISPNTFSSLSNLHTLTLSHNRLMRLGTLSLNGLHVLSSLKLSFNLIDDVQEGAFRNTSNLQEVSLEGNRLTLVPSELGHLRLLKQLDLCHNRIIGVERKSFQGMELLQTLRLEGNLISNVSQNLISGLPRLKVLNLARNQIHNAELGLFKQHIPLEVIRLDGNRLTQIGGLFVPLSKLRWLNISDNLINAFDYAMAPASLEWLDLHKNEIRELTDHYDKADSLVKLRTLDASFNRVSSLNSKSLPKSAETLMLNDNLISSVEHYTFFLLKGLSRVDLFANQITHMDLNALRLSSPNSSESAPLFSIGGNPFVCDCTMEWLQRYNSLDKLHRYPKIVDLESIYCRLIYSRQRGYIPLVEADASMFLCPYKRHCFTTCHCCEFDACDCEMTCPDKCNCYHDQSWSSNIIDCSNNGFDKIPEKLPMDATEVYLDGNNFQNLSSLTFLGRKNLEALFLNGSNINYVENLTFAGLPNLKHLHLEGNHLSEFYGQEFIGLTQLRELHLQNNQLSRVANSTFSELQHLEVLRLDDNRISNYSAWELQKNPYLVEITLTGNIWSCSCSFMQEFKRWLTRNVKKVDDPGTLTCWFDSVYEGPRILNENETCYVLESTTMVQRMIKSDYVPLIIATLIVLFLLVCLLVVVFVYRQEMRLCLYSRCGVRFCYRDSLDSEQGRVFDAFISYSEKDKSFVHHVLAPKLEQGEPPFRLALHYRDFPHSGYLADTIVEAVESSRRTIIVLSKNFIDNEWCRFQFKSAHHEVLKDCRKRLIVVLLGEIPLRELDPDLRLYLKTTSACLSWDDKLFWEKLRLAMPPSSNTSSIQHSISHYSEIDENRYYHTRPATMDSLWG